MNYAFPPSTFQNALNAVPELAALSPSLQVTVETTLPPVVGPGDNGTARLGVGGVQVIARLDSAVLTARIDATIGATAGLEVGYNGIELQPAVSIESFHTDLTVAGASGLKTETIEKLLAEMVLPIAKKYASELGGYPVPSFALTAVGFPDKQLKLSSTSVQAGPDGFVLLATPIVE